MYYMHIKKDMSHIYTYACICNYRAYELFFVKMLKTTLNNNPESHFERADNSNYVIITKLTISVSCDFGLISFIIC